MFLFVEKRKVMRLGEPGGGASPVRRQTKWALGQGNKYNGINYEREAVQGRNPETRKTRRKQRL